MRKALSDKAKSKRISVTIDADVYRCFEKYKKKNRIENTSKLFSFILNEFLFRMEELTEENSK
jgi:metal-responsive CopG/Arc/MetJ family transcriptional regulator